ncbi:MAG: 3-deoxy-7-phosphoheptulonate synthase [Verrucomicrobiota bacterium]
MSEQRVKDLHVVQNLALPSPRALVEEVPCGDGAVELVAQSRQEIRDILFGRDDRFLVVVGPCSIHDVKAGREYGERLAALSEEVKEKILVVMRVYFEKPRTTVGWKGLIMDPHLDGSNDISMGLRKAREFLKVVLELGLPTATELLDPITPQYIADMICWSAIGARTSESQTHRQMASGLSMPVGFKNTTFGGIAPAINAVQAAGKTQTFLGVSEEGQASAVSTSGNPDSHLILRGGSDGPNYGVDSVREVEGLLEKGGLPPAIMIDASHANCGKDQERMPGVFREIVEERAGGLTSIRGAMLESNLVAGNQKFPQPLEDLVYGQSITDQCIDWETTVELLREAAGRF